MKEVTSHSVLLSNGEKVSIQLEGLHMSDRYGTNLELTGHGNWFGSMNMCNLLADHYLELFSSQEGLNVLELGSGLGRAGLMAYKLANTNTPASSSNSTARFTLTDGEEEVVEMLKANFELNFGNECNECVCQQLWWGENEQLQALRQQHPRGFNLIIGADLIYGRDAVAQDDAARESFEGEETETSSAAAAAAAPAAPAAAVPECGFGRDKLNSLLYTVSALLCHRSQGNVSQDSPSQCNSQDQGNSSGAEAGIVAAAAAAPSSPFDLRRGGSFLLAVTRRELLSWPEMQRTANRYGLGVAMLEDYTFDIFDTCVDVDSLLWRDTILHLYRTA